MQLGIDGCFSLNQKS